MVVPSNYGFTTLFFRYDLVRSSRTVAHYAFEVETFLETGESVIATLRLFHANFMLRRNNADADINFNP